MINGYDFPEISYFEQGNCFTGCEGNEFRYRIAKIGDKKKDEDVYLLASVWYEDLCYEIASDKLEERFGISNEELVKAIEWIFSKKK